MEPKAQIEFRELTPDLLFHRLSYFSIGKDYASKQPPKMGALYLDRLGSSPGLFMPQVRYGSKTSGTRGCSLCGLSEDECTHKRLNNIVSEKKGIYDFGSGQSGRTYSPSRTGYTGTSTGTSTYSGNPISTGYSSNHLGYSPANSAYQS